MKLLTCEETSDLFLSKMTHKNLLKSSTMVRNCLWPWMEVWAKGPQMLKCSNSNLDLAMEWLELKGSFLCLAKRQTSQVALLSTEIEEYNWCILDNLWLDKCPNLKC